LDVSKNTKLIYLVCDSNQFTAEALNALFVTLHGNPPVSGDTKTIYIGNNLGTAACNRSTATNKGWTVIDIPRIMTMTTSANSVSISMRGFGTASINWGDGTASETKTFSSNLNTRFTHTYSGATTCTITIIGESITYLDCAGNQLTTLDVSDNTMLTRLECNYNKLTTLDISENTALTTLYCDSNHLAILDVSKNTALTVLSCEFNWLSATALNTLFGTLHGNTIVGGKWIYTYGNPGMYTCDRSIATGKGWTVD